MTDDELLAELRTAFPPRRIDASTAFVQRGRLYCDGPEVIALLHGKTWEEIDGTAFSRRSDSLHFLGDDHIRAVLPRALYLLVVLGPMSALGDMFPHYLRRKTSSDRHVTNLERSVARFDAWTNDLNLAQRRVVGRVLVEFAARFPNYADLSEVALDRFWRQWLD